MKDDAQAAIERARGHLRLAVRESLEATRALVEAALLTAGIDEASRAGLAGEVRSTLDHWITRLDQERAFQMPAAFVETLDQALEAEIDRWQKRSAVDASARPVLRVFLGLRELLWELGVRPNATSDKQSTTHSGARGAHGDAQATGTPDDPMHPDARADPEPSARPRVQRFDLEDG